ncbi:multiubiquitin domain-containing protein [Streptomyces aureus]|uniref:multiubiquitin domain-containing protein n=1 Tax=Streptomyces aureus TaxID=193461 RepID=UPI0005618B53|nr:multiubiquitin domain-containing protein [Streptomyces aureus]
MSSTVEQADLHAPGKGHTVTITVNNKAVEVIGPKATGLQIKEAAIAQGVEIQLDFQLSQELPSGETRIIGDTDVVTVNKKSVFTAVAGDDNS